VVEKVVGLSLQSYDASVIFKAGHYRHQPSVGFSPLAPVPAAIVNTRLINFIFLPSESEQGAEGQSSSS
jgi:hypothetical protein